MYVNEAKLITKVGEIFKAEKCLLGKCTYCPKLTQITQFMSHQTGVTHRCINTGKTLGCFGMIYLFCSILLLPVYYCKYATHFVFVWLESVFDDIPWRSAKLSLDGVISPLVLFNYLGFYVAFNTVQVISRRVVGRAEVTSTYSLLGFCTVNCQPTASNYQLSHFRL